MKQNQSKKILLIAQECNPDWPSVPRISYELCRSISRLRHVTIMTHQRNEQALKKALPEIEVISIPENKSEAIWYRMVYWLSGKRRWWPIHHLLSFPLHILFTLRVEDTIRRRLIFGEFGLVHVLTPMIPRYPSPLVDICHQLKIPLVLGPVNGGLPYPKNSGWISWKEGGILSWLKHWSHCLPSTRKSYKQAAHVFCGSEYTSKELRQHYPEIFDRLEWFPENGIREKEIQEQISIHHHKLRLCFAGRLVPYKGCDLALKALARALSKGLTDAHLEIVGDGPERHALEALATRLNIKEKVTFRGNCSREDVLRVMKNSDLLVFPSRREFGGGVVLEAMACGCVPIVVAHGGPNEITSDLDAFKIVDLDPTEIIKSVSNVILECQSNPIKLKERRFNAMDASRKFTWESKAERVVKVYNNIQDSVA